MKPGVCGFFVLTAIALCACGGGGSGSGASGGGGAGATIVPTATSTPASGTTASSLSVSGSVVELVSGAALAGFTVTVGQVPPAATCLNGESNASMPCGIPAAPATTAATGGNGSFTIAVPSAGTYMLTIGKDTTYATIHRTIAVTASGLTLGTLKVAALSSDEQAWLIDVNTQRATVSYPTSFSNLTVDEYAEEQARQWASDVLAGKTIYGDAGYGPYQSAYGSSLGSLYAAAGTLSQNIAGQTSAFKLSDNVWMSEKSNCPGGNWQTCTYSPTTGHYINISNTQMVWLGLGEAWNTADPLAQYSYYDLMLIQN
jgi:hypothetical protein